MGSHPHGKLYYGIAIGGEDCGWNFDQLGGKYGTTPTFDWYEGEREDDENYWPDSLGQQIDNRLKALGFKRGYDRDVIGLQQVGYYDSADYVFGMEWQSAYGGEKEEIDLTEMLGKEDWMRAEIQRAAAALGMTFGDQVPQWWVGSTYG